MLIGLRSSRNLYPLRNFVSFALVRSSVVYQQRKPLNHIKPRAEMSSLVSNKSVLCDFDANLLHKDLRDDIAHHIKQASEHAHVKLFVVPGSTLADSAEAVALAQNSEMQMNIIATAGIHPYHVAAVEHAHGEDVIAALIDIITSGGEACKAVGETGLDYSEGFPDKALQLPWMRSQVQLALDTGKPLFLHERNAHTDFVAVLNELGFGESGPPPVACCVHCFTGTLEELTVYVNMGFYIGLTGSVITAHKKVAEAEVVVGTETCRVGPYPELNTLLQLIPEDRLVIETDAPYMGFKGCRNSESKKKNQRYPNVPAALGTVCAFIAEASQKPYEHVATTTTANARRFFAIPDPDPDSDSDSPLSKRG